MNLGKLLVGKDRKGDEVKDENPFRWAERIGDSTGGQETVSEKGGVEATEKAPDLAGEGPVKERREWFGGTTATRKQVDVRDDHKIEIKRNDLWESDWEVHVSRSGTVDFVKSEVKVGKRLDQGWGARMRRTIGRLFGRWFR